jgi:HD superfamily phosphohydrolase
MLEKLDPRQLQLPDLEIGEQDGAFFESLPYSDFRRWVPENSIYTNALNQIPNLNRLSNVKCLSFLSYVGPDPKNTYFIEFPHSRLDHTLTVALITEEILKQNGFSQDQINLGIVAALLHDIATPAYGDATKQVDPVNLHEENHWQKMLDKEGKDFIHQFGTEKMLDTIIKNQGVLGKVLDVSDRITYTMKDLSALQIIAPLETGQKSQILLRKINKIITHYPKIGNIYKTVGVDQKKQEVFFNDPQMLNVFLNLRAHLHQKLYVHPINQAKDLFVSKAIGRLYSNDKSFILNPDNLRQMNDYDLMKTLSKFYNRSAVVMHLNLVNWRAEFRKFSSIDRAKEEERMLKQKENIAVIGIKDCQGFNPATDYKVFDGHNYVDFKYYDISAADEIEKTANATRGIYLFWTDVSEKSEINDLIKTVLKIT